MKQYHKHQFPCFTGAIISIFLSTVFSVALQFFKGDVLDFAVTGAFAPALRATFMLLTFILLEVVSYYIFQRFSAKYAIGCISELRQDIIWSILNRSYVEYQKHPQGDYLAKYMTEAEAIRDRLFRMRPMLWEILFRIILVSAALFWLDWRIALVTLALLTTPLYIPKLIEARLQNAQTAYLQAMETNLAKVTDWLSCFEIIKNYSIEAKIRKQFNKINGDAMTKLLKDTRLGALSQLVTTLISYLSYFVVLLCATLLVLRREFSAGDFFIAIGMIDQLSYPLISLSAIIRDLVAIRPVCTEMTAFLQSPTPKTKNKANAGLHHSIRFHQVSYAYDVQRKVLDGFDLTIQKGKRYLLRGPSGCGKTTVVNLLLRYHVPSGGRIEIDGAPLEALDDPYSLFTVVRQEAALFHDTLRNNLTMYRSISDDRLLDVLQQVGLTHCACSQALDSIIAPGGANLSGGEKKRISLARALLRDTDTLILDEPLANLDPATAGRIEDLLLSIPDKTILIVSHQFSEEKLHCFAQVIDFSQPT